MQTSKQQRLWITIAVLTGMLLAAMESTVVSTAMPTVIASLGGLARYSWVFSIYLLTSTVSMPIWGKLSDLYGRRSAYLLGISIFLIGSVLSGLSQSMNQLIIFRALQGLGAGAIIPLGLTIIGEIYTIQERAKMQGLFSSVWGIASILGPVLGGFISDNFSWRWVFYINIPFGLLATLVVSFSMKNLPISTTTPKIDYAGAISLTALISLLLIVCLESKEISSSLIIVSLLVTCLFLLFAFIYFEKQAIEPILPLSLFQERIFLISSVGNFLLGCVLFGTLSFVPLFMQSVLKSTATEAGKTIMFLLFSWIFSSFISSKLILRFGYRPLVILGMIALVLGNFLLILAINPNSNKYYIYLSIATIGIGMGLATFAILMAVQTQVEHKLLGVVTSSTQFFRNIGGVLGTGILGSILAFSLAKITGQASNSQVRQELTQIVDNPSIIFDSSTRLNLTVESINIFAQALSNSLHSIFTICFFLSLLGLLTALLIPSSQSNEFKEISLLEQEKINTSH